MDKFLDMLAKAILVVPLLVLGSFGLFIIGVIIWHCREFSAIVILGGLTLYVWDWADNRRRHRDLD